LGLKTEPGALKGRVLIAEDDEAIRHAYTRTLESVGHEVVGASDGKAAIALVGHPFDVILTDISMPGASGVDLLREIRRHDLDVPVIMVTGNPEVASAIAAVENGALGYLVKPVRLAELLEAVQRALRLHQMAKLKREAVEMMGKLKMQVGDRAGLETRFQSSLGRLWLALQPIVRCSTKEIFAFEALMRSDEPTLAMPLALLDAAERLGRQPELSARLRDLAAEVTHRPGVPRLFVNLHPLDLLDDSIFSLEAPLSRVAKSVVLEITERASLDEVKDVRARVQRLRALGFEIAVDDLGSGYAGLNSFAQLEPEFVKLDMTLVRDVDQRPTQRRLIGSMVSLCKDLGIGVIAEGIETAAERDVLLELGCDLLQGYYFARPARELPAVKW
jgi:EAL domain-containing protein (putative c-di-GMP-specific phosphodiesterase class I)